ncbi:MAG: hypothetical protein KAT77_01245 [Nanoarchaeota archaeon]|nr:hypothetical protein [Nanoarchaeota archaeon]
MVVFTNEYEAIAELFKVKKSGIDSVAQPRLGTKKRKGAKYVQRSNENIFNLNQEELKQRIKIFEAILQPGLSYNIFLPQNKIFFEEVMQGKIPQQVYIGLGYNDKLNVNGERLDILNLFSWAKRAQQGIPELELIIWDASCYQAVNMLDPKKIPAQFSADTAQEILGTLGQTLKENSQIRENSELREKYLKAFMSTLDIKGRVIPARDYLTGQETEYSKQFQKCLDFCRDPSTDQLKIVRAVQFGKIPDRAKVLYTPMEIAEALLLLETYGNDIKLGPTSEKCFDKFIVAAARELNGAQYKSIWYTRPPGKPASYLTNDGNSIDFNDSTDIIGKKLENQSYRNWLGDVIKPFSTEPSLEDNINKVITTVKGELR